MKKWSVVFLSAVLCASLAACAGKTPSVPDSIPDDGETQYGEDSAARAAMDWEAAYEEKFVELEQANGDEELYRTVLQCGTGEKILVVTSSVYAGGQTIEADVYQYADGEVKYIASVSSTGTAYPLAFTEEAVLFGGNHTAGKLVIHNGTAELYQLVGMNIEGRVPVLETYDVADGERVLKSSEELSPEEVDSFDYYTNAFADEQAQMIDFRTGTTLSVSDGEEETTETDMETSEISQMSLPGIDNDSGTGTDLDAADDDVYSFVTTLSAQEVEAFALQARQAYLEQDWETLSGMIRYPVTLYPDVKVNDTEEFFDYVNGKSFAKEDLANMEEETCKNMFANGQGICMGAGEIWFLDVHFDGIEQTDTPLLKIIALNGWDGME